MAALMFGLAAANFVFALASFRDEQGGMAAFCAFGCAWSIAWGVHYL